MKILNQFKNTPANFIKWVKLMFEGYKVYTVDGIIGLLGLAGFIAWLSGYEPAFLAIGFLLYSSYTAFRLNDGRKRYIELKKSKE